MVKRFQLTDNNLDSKYWKGNLPFQIIMARLYYYRFSEALPAYDDIEGLAKYWKKYWNTELGAGTVGEAIVNYYRYC